MPSAPPSFEDIDDQHPIDIVEALAEQRAWDFDRVKEDQIAMNIKGNWYLYSLTLAWSSQDDTLRLICTFDLAPPVERLPALYELLNRCNDMVWAGAFTWWKEQSLMVWRYGLVLEAGQTASPAQIDRLIGNAVNASERFFPAFYLIAGSDETPAEAMKIAINEAFGQA